MNLSRRLFLKSVAIIPIVVVLPLLPEVVSAKKASMVFRAPNDPGSYTFSVWVKKGKGAWALLGQSLEAGKTIRIDASTGDLIFRRPSIIKE